MSTSHTEPLGEYRIPDHTLIRRIGRGSSGEVWLARSAVTGAWHAVKIIRRDNFAEEAPYLRELKGIRKFEPISRSHPGFVNILHVGHAEEDGYFYYLMELADGVLPAADPRPITTIEQLIREGRRLSVDDVLDLGLRLSDALHFLHEAGLIHRDIKPSNLLFVAGRPKLADIGLVTDEEDAASLVGTPGYIPPEGPGSRQADVFALGKVLYECLTGLDRSRFPDLPTFFDGHPDQEGFLELNEIVLKACHPDFRERYQTARQMHADFIAIENGESVIRLRELEFKLSRFKRMVRVAAVILVAAGIAGFVVQRELHFRDQERQRSLGTLIGDSVRAINDGNYAGALRHTASVLDLVHSAEADPIVRLRYSTTLGQMPKLTLLQALDAGVGWCEFTRDESGVFVGLADGRCQLRNISSGRVVAEFPGHTNSISALATSPDGRWLLSAGNDGTARVWEIAGPRLLHVLSHAHGVSAADFHPSGRQLATASEDGTVRIWDFDSGKVVREIKAHFNRVEAVRFNHSGNLLASGSRDNTVCLWRFEDGERIGEPIKHAGWVFSISFSPDDRRFVTACADHAAYVWSVDSGQLALPPLRHERGVHHVEFSPDGSVIASAGWDDALCIWDSATGELEPPSLRHSSPLNCVGFSPAANRLVTGCTDGTIRVWDRAGRKSARRLVANHISSDGSSFLRLLGDTVEVFSITSPQEARARIKVSSLLKDASLDANGSLLATVETSSPPGRVLRVWDANRGEPRSPAIPLSVASSRTYFDPIGASIAVVENNSVSIFGVNSGERMFPSIVMNERIGSLTFSLDGSKFAIASSGQVEIRNAQTGQLVVSPLAHQSKVSAVVFSPDSRRLVTCTSDTQIAARYAQVWDVATGSPLGGKLWHRDGVTAAAWTRDGRSLITVSEQGVGQIWSVPGGELVGREMLHREQILYIALRADPGLALTASGDFTARLWDAQTGDAVSPPYRFPDSVGKVWFSPDPTRFIVREVGGPIWVQELDAMTWPPSVLQDLADVLAGRSTQSAQTDDFTGARMFAARWEKLRSDHAEWFSVSKEELLNWRRAGVERFRQAKQWRLEWFQLNEIVRMGSSTTNTFRRMQELEQIIGREKTKN